MIPQVHSRYLPLVTWRAHKRRRVFRRSALFVFASALVALFAFLFMTATSRADEPAGAVPEEAVPYPADRYANLWAESLFFKETDSPAADPGFARDLTLAGTYEIEGRLSAILMNRRTQSVQEVSQAGPNGNGLRLIEVNRQADPAKTRVLVEQNGHRAWIDSSTDRQKGPSSPSDASMTQLPPSPTPQLVRPAVLDLPAEKPLKTSAEDPEKPALLSPPSPLEEPEDFTLPVPAGESR